MFVFDSYKFLVSAPRILVGALHPTDSGPGSASRPSRFTCEERAAGIHLTKSWVELGASLDAEENTKLSASAKNRTRIPRSSNL